MRLDSKVPLYDLHCHLDLFDNPAKAFEDCATIKVITLTVTTTPLAWPQNANWASGRDYVIPALGLHPELIATHAHEVDRLIELMGEAHWIGEVGLDGSPRFRDSQKAQLTVFHKIVAAARQRGGRVLSIHSRSAAKDVIATLRPDASSAGIQPILHWFSGSTTELRSALDIGCSFSINGSMTATAKGRELVSRIPVDRLLLESDAPFRGFKTSTARLEDLNRTLSDVAVIKKLDLIELQYLLADNASKLLHIPGKRN